MYLSCIDAQSRKKYDKIRDKSIISLSPFYKRLFYQAGMDVLATDKLGKLALTREGCKQRDKLVLQLAKASAIPVVVVMGGGYSADINDVVEAHCNTFRVARDLYG